MNCDTFIQLYTVIIHIAFLWLSQQDEKAHHQLEKKELEQKLNSEMESKIEQQRESAIKRENLLQEELKTLQVTLTLVLYEKD